MEKSALCAHRVDLGIAPSSPDASAKAWSRPRSLAQGRMELVTRDAPVRCGYESRFSVTARQQTRVFLRLPGEGGENRA